MLIIGSALIEQYIHTGTIASGSVGYFQYANLSEESVRMERLKTVYNVSILSGPCLAHGVQRS